MRLKLIACKVLYREVSLLTYDSVDIIDVSYLRQGYHNTPEKLNRILQSIIDDLDNGDEDYSYQAGQTEDDYDAILLGYGLCSNAIAGLCSKRYKLVVPRAHDCITLFLGAKEKYREYFDGHSGGIYWYTGGWIDNSPMPGEGRVEQTRKAYIEKYGEDNADYLMEMEQNWLREYDLCAFVDWKELDTRKFVDYTKKCAEYLNWQLDILEGSSDLMRRFLTGQWNKEDFLVLEPGQTLTQSFDKNIIKAK